VRIALDDKELDQHPLRVGLSADVTVDITDDKGAMNAAPGNGQPIAQTTVYDQMASKADEEAEKIIQANLSQRDAN
jgi:membrane fusion protein (multidrug efflux system)